LVEYAGYGVPMTWSLKSGMAALILAATLPLSVVATTGVAASSAQTTCHAPQLTRLTVAAARTRAKAAGCALRLAGASVKMPSIQTIRAQNVPAGRVAKSVTVTVNPLCSGPADPGPPPGEPLITAGASELVTGLFLEGGPVVERSAPVCKNLVGKSTGGTITITNVAGTTIANAMKLTPGQLLYVNVPAGPYTISGVFSNGTTVGPITVTVASDQVVRQDLVIDVP
jgi:hypothetical protein